ncbi:MAG: hypothetical protein WCR31_08605 [Treponema sp.]
MTVDPEDIYSSGRTAALEMIKQADKSLYEEKRMHHILRHN